MMGSAAVPNSGTDIVLRVLDLYDKDKGFKAAIKALEAAESRNAEAARNAGQANAEQQAVAKALAAKELELTSREKALEKRERKAELADQQLVEKRAAFLEEQARSSGEIMAAQADLEAKKNGLKGLSDEIAAAKNGLEASRQALKKRWAKVEQEEARVLALQKEVEERAERVRAALAA